MENNKLTLLNDMHEKLSCIKHKMNNTICSMLFEEQYDELIKFKKILDYIDSELEENNHANDNKKFNEYLKKLRIKYFDELTKEAMDKRCWRTMGSSGNYLDKVNVEYHPVGGHSKIYLTCHFVKDSVNMFNIDKNIVVHDYDDNTHTSKKKCIVILKNNLLIKNKNDFVDGFNYINNNIEL
jgi:hypothetical protein